jgi:hypothetical protein
MSKPRLSTAANHIHLNHCVAATELGRCRSLHVACRSLHAFLFTGPISALRIFESAYKQSIAVCEFSHAFMTASFVNASPLGNLRNLITHEIEFKLCSHACSVLFTAARACCRRGCGFVNVVALSMRPCTHLLAFDKSTQWTLSFSLCLR